MPHTSEMDSAGPEKASPSNGRMPNDGANKAAQADAQKLRRFGNGKTKESIKKYRWKERRKRDDKREDGEQW